MDIESVLKDYFSVMSELKSSVSKLDKSQRVILEKDIAKMEKGVKELDLDKIKEVAANIVNYGNKDTK
jgi:hypothetical protein